MTITDLGKNLCQQKVFGLAPQPKGIGDDEAQFTIVSPLFLFGLAPQPKGIGDLASVSLAFSSSRSFGLAPQPKGIGDTPAFDLSLDKYLFVWISPPAERHW